MERKKILNVIEVLFQMLKNKVLLLKAPSDDKVVDPYQDELEKAGFNAIMIPVIQFNFVRTSELIEKLTNPSRYIGMVLTSKRAVEAVKIVSILQSEIFLTVSLRRHVLTMIYWICGETFLSMWLVKLPVMLLRFNLKKSYLF